MRLEREENVVKLHILTSLARSQRAMARMIENVADIMEASEESARQLSQNLEAIMKYQRMLAMKITGIRLRDKKTCIPAKPWLNKIMKQGRGHDSKGK